MNNDLPTPLTAQQVRDYHEHGWTLVPSALSVGFLTMLRANADDAVARVHADMDRMGKDVVDVNMRGKRYFITNPSEHRSVIYDFIYSPMMAGICRQLLGDDVRVFYEQYVIKGAEIGTSFSWHQDSGYVTSGVKHAPYLTCWIALDDMSEANGTVSILPTSRLGIKSVVEHKRDPNSTDMVGYFGSDPGDRVDCPAGSMALFSSVTFHRSGNNKTNAMRRVYLIQYTAGRLLKPDGTPDGRDEVLLANGRLMTPPLAS